MSLISTKTETIKIMQKTVHSKLCANLYMIMKLSSIQLFIAILFAGFGYANESTAQEILSRPVTLQVVKADLRSVLNKLEKNAGVKFA